MALDPTPWRRQSALRPFRRDMDDLFDRFLRGLSVSEGPEEWDPSVDMSERDGSVTMRAELPGLEAGDIDIDITGDVLTLRGEKKFEKEKKGERYFRRERHYGSFQRSFQLPSGVQGDKADATFKNGILTVEMPKVEERGRKKN